MLYVIHNQYYISYIRLTKLHENKSLYTQHNSLSLLYIESMKKLRVNIGHVTEEKIRLPIYKNIPVETEFIKIYRIMEHMMTKLTRPELMLSIFLSKKGGETGIVYNNKRTRDEFIEYLNQKSKGKLTYKTQTIHQAFSSLKKYGMLVSYEDVEGAYWTNPAFVFIGKDNVRERIFIDIDSQEFEKEMLEQKK